MPKFLMIGSYSVEGAKGLLKDGGSKRRQVAEAALFSGLTQCGSCGGGFVLASDDRLRVSTPASAARVTTTAISIGTLSKRVLRARREPVLLNPALRSLL